MFCAAESDKSMDKNMISKIFIQDSFVLSKVNVSYIRSYYLLIGRHETFVYLHVVVWTITIILQIEG